jgi:hypothetical protein
MGHHYVPQQYLKGFATPKDPTIIWMYDKTSGPSKRVPIRAVAQAANYFDPQTEADLNSLVEGPAQAALLKLVRNEPISSDERVKVSLYIATMVMRVPRRRRQAHELIPAALEQTMNDIRVAINELRQRGADEELIAERLREHERVHEEFLRKSPAAVLDHLRSPWPSANIHAAIHGMTWRIAFNPQVQLITSDNPAYFFERYGLGKPESELTFPLTSRAVLFGSWRGPREGLIHMEVRPIVIREANRRIAYGAERVVFYHNDEEWVSAVATKPSLELNRIEW